MRRMRSQQGLRCCSMSLTTQVELPFIAPESIQMTFCEAPSGDKVHDRGMQCSLLGGRLH